jgi:hypothetical protein
MNAIEPNRQSANAHDRQIAISEFYELKSELKAHSATDELQFATIREKLAEIGKVVNRISWAGWGVAGGVLALLYHTFFK